MIRGRDTNADLLVCFPKRAQLTLMPPRIAGSPESTMRHHKVRHARNKSMPGIGIGRGGHFSPLPRSNHRQNGAEVCEPTSPKVTCAGQIKAANGGASSYKRWQTVMQEIEKIHVDGNRKKRSNFMKYMGFKKDILSFLTCLRSLRLDFRCFGAPPQHEISSDEEEEDQEFFNDANDSFIVRINRLCKEANTEEEDGADRNDDKLVAPVAPPPNALLLMRCRSAPSKNRFKEEEDGNGESNKEKDRVYVMRYDAGLCKISDDVAEETWVVGGVANTMSRSRSWRG